MTRTSSVLKLIVLALILLTSRAADAADYYVDNQAAGGNNGGSWTDAWQSFADISWASIQPGDTIYLSGGSVSKTYYELLIVGAGGSEGQPITIRVGQDSGHNGTVVIESPDFAGILLSDSSYVHISGQVGSDPEQRMMVSTPSGDGISITGDSRGFDIGHMEITECSGNAITTQLDFGHAYGEIHHCEIHDNGGASNILAWAFPGTATQYGSLKIHNNDIYHFSGDGMQIVLSEVDIFDNTIHDDLGELSGEHTDGIQIWGSHHRIFNNHFYNFVRPNGESHCNSYIRYNPDQSDTGHLHIFNNIFAETNTPTGVNYFRGLEISPTAYGSALSCTNVLIANNVFRGTPLFTVFMGLADELTAVSDIRVLNNVFVDSALLASGGTVFVIDYDELSEGMGSDGDGEEITIDYNAFFASSGDWTIRSAINGVTYEYADLRSTFGVQDHDVTSDPMIGSDYRPSETSPLIDVGVDLSGDFTEDREGVPRPVGNAWDLGPFEYGGSPPSDGGVGGDAGSDGDAAVLDGSVGTDAGSGGSADSGCGCATERGTRGGGVVFFLFLTLLLISITYRRR